MCNELVSTTGITHKEPQALEAQHKVVHDNQKGISYDNLFGPYLLGVSKITITDPYIRKFYQIRNLMELLETVCKNKRNNEEVEVKLITTVEDDNSANQKDLLNEIKESVQVAGICFTWEFVERQLIHPIHIVTDNGWKISIDRGLDIFKPYEMNKALVLENRLQQFRSCRLFEVTFIADESIATKNAIAS